MRFLVFSIVLIYFQWDGFSRTYLYFHKIYNSKRGRVANHDFDFGIDSILMLPLYLYLQLALRYISKMILQPKII